MKEWFRDSLGKSMAKQISDNGLAFNLDAVFSVDERPPCPTGTALLRTFAEARPADFIFLKPGDLADLHNSAFAGIPEWEAFSDHYGSCELCNAELV
jgi:hypothetical protein